ncbi:hypothetical protein C7W93_13515 [Glaciimonas sp. PCH181]|nr:hypothetical protein C7W93_13515 [Glaciimonas sp. PCH181]
MTACRLSNGKAFAKTRVNFMCSETATVPEYINVQHQDSARHDEMHAGINCIAMSMHCQELLRGFIEGSDKKVWMDKYGTIGQKNTVTNPIDK